MVGYAFVDPVASAAAVIDNQTTAFLTAIAKGTVTGYGPPFAPFSNPANIGKSIQLTAGNDTVSTVAADPAFQSSDKDDTFVASVAGRFVSTDNINGDSLKMPCNNQPECDLSHNPLAYDVLGANRLPKMGRVQNKISVQSSQ